MVADNEQPNWLGVNIIDRRFRFPSSDPTKYPWDIRGGYDIRDGAIHITEIAITPNPDARAPIEGLDSERIRRLTRLSPIKRAIRDQEHADKQRITEAVQAGTRSAYLRDLAAKLEQSWLKPRNPDEPNPRHRDDDWASWALDYLNRVDKQGSAYGVQRDIADDGSWGVSYETVRSRVKTLRRLGWITGEGHLASPGPALTAHLPDHGR